MFSKEAITYLSGNPKEFTNTNPPRKKLNSNLGILSEKSPPKFTLDKSVAELNQSFNTINTNRQGMQDRTTSSQVLQNQNQNTHHSSLQQSLFQPTKKHSQSNFSSALNDFNKSFVNSNNLPHKPSQHEFASKSLFDSKYPFEQKNSFEMSVGTFGLFHGEDKNYPSFCKKHLDAKSAEFILGSTCGVAESEFLHSREDPLCATRFIRRHSEEGDSDFCYVDDFEIHNDRGIKGMVYHGKVKKSGTPMVYETEDKNRKYEISSIVILHEPPVVGEFLRANVHLIDSEGNESVISSNKNSKNGHRVIIKWFRGIKRICSTKNCGRSGNIQCLSCVKLNVSAYNSYFCSPEHLKFSWNEHKKIHDEKIKDGKAKEVAWNETDGEFVIDFSNLSDASVERGSVAFQCLVNKDDYNEALKKHINLDSVEAVSQYFPPLISNIWGECSTGESYVPSEDDAGRQILIECSVANAYTGKQLTGTGICWTSPVLPPFEFPPLRKFIPYHDLAHSNFHESSIFRIMSYNILADIYTSAKRYSYTQFRFLDWQYRFNFIINEILRYRSEIVCIQEMQLNHYDSFFKKKLKPEHYCGIFKKKTRHSLFTDARSIDGCALFYDRRVFRLLNSYSVEFNDAAQRLFGGNTECWIEIAKRLKKDNIALVVVLEEIATKRRLCVVNTHIYWDPEYSDVKLWQTLILCNELQKFRKSENLPLIICGDFNSTPDSTVYKVLTTGTVAENDPALTDDKFGIFKQGIDLSISPFVSAYKMVMKKEPEFTNYTVDFKGCIDYIMYARGSLQALSVLDTYPEQVLREHTALPSPRIASDHIQLVAEFAFT